ncbi:MAG: hypothetical protein IJT34_01915 [Butyrivibrio sp.]|nr:hypothetical protein [Butyrivibrio sp.]
MTGQNGIGLWWESLSSIIPGGTLGTALVLAVISCILIPVIGLILDALESGLYGIGMRILGQKLGYWVILIITWPGVIMHEFAHALFALVTGARVTRISFLPEKTEGGYILGCVEYGTRGPFPFPAIQNTLSASAPTVVGLFLSGLIMTCLDRVPGGTLQGVLIYAALCMLCHSSMSKQDLKNYWRGVPVLFLLLFAGFLLMSRV